jgi:hypothetical protein
MRLVLSWVELVGPVWGTYYLSAHSLYVRFVWYKRTPWPESVSELYRPSDRRLSAKWLPTFADRECHTVSVTGPYDRILGFLDRSRYVFFQVASQFYSRGWVDPVPDPLLLKKSVARNTTGGPTSERLLLIRAFSVYSVRLCHDARHRPFIWLSGISTLGPRLPARSGQYIIIRLAWPLIRAHIDCS